MNRFDFPETALPYSSANLPNRQRKAISQSPRSRRRSLLAIFRVKTCRPLSLRPASFGCASHCLPDAAAHETRLLDPGSAENIAGNAARAKRKASAQLIPMAECGQSPLLGFMWRRLFAWRVSFFARHFLLRGNIVFGLGYPHQPMVEPADDILESLDAMPWLARAR